jgi:hypothetical protein
VRRDIINLMLGLFFLTAGLSACGSGETGNGGANSISGTIAVSTNGVGLSQVSLTLFGSGSGNIFTDFNGFYSFPGLLDGTYTIIPSKTGYIFLPTELVITINGASLTDQNFIAYATAPANPKALFSADFDRQPEGPLAR